MATRVVTQEERPAGPVVALADPWPWSLNGIADRSPFRSRGRRCASLGGQDGFPNPVGYALAGLLSCQAVSYRVWAAQLGIEVENIDIAIEGDLDARGFFGLDEQTHPGFGQIRAAVQVRGPEAPQRYAELQAAVGAHCPVLDLFANPTRVHTALTVG